jgi:hypothetical protein
LRGHCRRYHRTATADKGDQGAGRLEQEKLTKLEKRTINGTVTLKQYFFIHSPALRVQKALKTSVFKAFCLFYLIFGILDSVATAPPVKKNPSHAETKCSKTSSRLSYGNTKATPPLC